MIHSYDSENQEHEQTLEKLYSAIFGHGHDAGLDRLLTEEWTEVGF